MVGRFELSRRRDTLSFGHHAEVAALPEPEQDYWLRMAEEFGWSTIRLRQQVRSSLAERRQLPLGLEPGPVSCNDSGLSAGRQLTVRVILAPGPLALCEQAARSHRMTLRDWAARVLEQAPQGQHHASGADQQSGT